MNNFSFGNVSIYTPKGIELGFLFQDPLSYPHKHTEKSPFFFSDGLGKIETHDDRDHLFYNIGRVSGIVVPDNRIEPNAGLWIMLPTHGCWGTLYLESHAMGEIEIKFLKSKNLSDAVSDQSSIRLAGSSTYIECNIMSNEVLWLFVSGGNGELFIHRATFVPVQSL
ncbi:hypothetical protein [Thioclava kandeliae]|uniref:Uncharacterized protein n=1 Tax=Thioclava kandeliae TaxID=3070818 RepID=A0ABV1SM11_9RHOB